MSFQNIPKELIDADAQKVIRHLSRNGYQAYLVGGCVRDLLLGRKPKDFDIATNARPAEIRDLFRNCRIIGRRFRLAHIVFGKKIIETATFRANPRPDAAEGGAGGEAGDSGTENEAVSDVYIHRDNVFGSAEEDARRRDFTINGLFYDLSHEQVIDYVNGLSDLHQRSLRTIGDPNVRFREDPVRILRAVKFAARLGFDIEDQTYRAMIAHHREIKKSAAPRVLEEIYRLLRGGAALESMVLLHEVGLIGELLPEVAEVLRENPAALDPFLRLLDERVAEGELPSNAALLCLLFAPRLLSMFDDEQAPRDPAPIFDATLGSLAERLRIARRDMERVRLLLLSQKRIAQALRRKHKLPGAVLVRDHLPESLALFELVARAAPLQFVEGPIAPGSVTQIAPSVPARFGDGLSAAPGEDGRGAADGDSGRRTGRGRSDESDRRRQRRDERRDGSAPVGAISGEEEAVGDEDAAIAAFTAALGSRPLDE